MSETVLDVFRRTAATHSERAAIRAGTVDHSYAELEATALRWARALGPPNPEHEGFTAVLGRRSFVACAAQLASMLRGHAFVPITPIFPAPKLWELTERCGARSVIVDAEGFERLEGFLECCDVTLTILVPGVDLGDLPERYPQHDWLDENTPRGELPPPPSLEDLTYLLFTSGSTGQPKMVPVTHANVVAFMAAVHARHDFGPEDRFSQTFEFSFDMSIWDLYVPWSVGACVVLASATDLRQPAHYLSREKLTVWFCVPSLGALMQRTRALAPGFYPHLRVVLFAGEALPAAVAQAFQDAAPNAVVENWYGPTEVTMCCVWFTYNPDTAAVDCPDGIVPIGVAFPQMEARVGGPDLLPVPDGQTGELMMAGPQVADGYLHDPERTKKSFVVPPGDDRVFYRTGDEVIRERGVIRYLGRLDFQTKVKGFRVEVGELESFVRDRTGAVEVVAIPWPVNAFGAQGLWVFTDSDPGDLVEAARRDLPHYLVPSGITVLERFPNNTNGKVDRKQLKQMLEDAGKK